MLHPTALNFLATGMSQQAQAASCKLGTATLSCIIKEMCRALWMDLKDDYLKFPQVVQWEAICQERLGFPQLHWDNQWETYPYQSTNSGNNFFNYKGLFSFIFKATRDAKYRFIFVNIGAYGRDSDAGVFAWMNLGAQLNLRTGSSSTTHSSAWDGCMDPSCLCG